MKDIRQLTASELASHVAEFGQPSFRAKQVHEWLWKKSAASFDEMKNLPVVFREELKVLFNLTVIKHGVEQISSDGTIKNTFVLEDGNKVEGVLIPSTERVTACVSSQVGCSLKCKFCATGFMGRLRNLKASEIYDQVVLMRRQSNARFERPLSNIVFMGMGEPLLNYSEVLKGIDLITSSGGLGMAPKRITVSTAGIAKMIRRLGDDMVKFNLALSLHAANDAKRSSIMPINEQNSLADLREALKYYYLKTKNQITYEYIVFNNFNDTLQDAKELVEYCRHLPSKVNIIEYNAITESAYINASNNKVEAFSEYIRRAGVNVNIRRSRGKDIDAACGQLAAKS